MSAILTVNYLAKGLITPLFYITIPYNPPFVLLLYLLRLYLLRTDLADPCTARVVNLLILSPGPQEIITI